MNEELKIIITAVTDAAQKNLDKVSKSVKNVGAQGKSSGASFGTAMKGMGKAAAIGAAAAVAAVGAITTALVALGKSTAEYRKEQAKLNTAFLAAGSSSEQAAQTYADLFRFLGDGSKATEAAGHLAKLTTDERELAEWTTTLQGVYATFGDSLPIEGLTEAANETARVGTVTGTLADALNWAGVNEDAFNAQLAATSSLEEREALIRGTLNGLYSDAAAIYEKNNADILAQNEAQARLNATTGQLGKTVMPLMTALLNLSNVLLTALGPAITVISNVLTKFINIISQAVSWVVNLVTALGGGSKKAAASAQQLTSSVAGIGGGMDGAANGAGALTGNLSDATKQAEKLKRTTAGFDELNIMSSGSSASAAGGGGGSAAGGGVPGANLGNFALGGADLTSGFEEAGKGVDKFAAKITSIFENLKARVKAWAQMFTPTFEAWKGAFSTISASWNASKDNFISGLQSVWSGFVNVGAYLLNTFIPTVVNSFSTNLAPMYGDVFGFYIEEAGKNFAFLGDLINSVCADIINPALDSIAKVMDGTFKAFGDAWAKHGTPLIEGLTTFFDGLREDINELYEAVILPIWTKIKEVFDWVWTEGLQPLVANIADAAMEIGVCLLALYNKTIKPIVDWIQAKIYPIIVKVVQQIVQNIGSTVNNIAKALSGVVTAIKGVVQFITGVFTGDWKKAWEGVKNIFKGIWDALVNIVKIPINTIIGGLNGLLKGLATAVNAVIKAINKLSFTVPDWVPGIGGKKFGFNLKEVTAPQIPKLATGGIVTSATQIIAGERGREAILPLENNTDWMDKLADRIAARNTSPSKIVLMVNERELGWATIHGINGITKQTGGIQLQLV